ncbi:MAG: 4-hydroxy-tetrahydrodipicolinate reductase [Candidatus Bathyarchaeia archaeon]
MRSIKICVAGADGRMGSVLVQEAARKDTVEVVGAVTSEDSPNRGKKLGDLGLKPEEVYIFGSSQLPEAVKPADVYVTFTTPKAELSNIPIVVGLKKKVVLGTTGFTQEELKYLTNLMADKVPAVVSTNFSIGINLLYRMLELMKTLPKQYDFTVIEAHHKGKVDAPSGTAITIASLLQRIRGYGKIVYGRTGISKRMNGELEVLSARIGGIPGIHEVIVAGENEMIKIEHTAFSRKVFADGALLAIEWISKLSKPGVYSMSDVLSKVWT